PELQEKFVDFLIAFTSRQPGELADALLDLSITTGTADRDGLRERMESFVRDYSNKPLSEISFARLAASLLAIVREQRLQLPREVALIFKVMLMVEGIGVQLNPDFDLMGVLTPYVRRLMKERLSFAAMSQRILRASTDAGA